MTAMHKDRLLLLDPEDISAHYFSSLIQPLQLEIIRCRKSAQLLARLEPEVSLVVLDAHSTRHQPASFWKKLRQAAQVRPIIALSHQHEREARLALFRHGVDDVLLKPLDAEELCARLTAQLNQYHRYREHLQLHAPPARLQVGPLTLEQSTSCLQYKDRQLTLSKTEFLVLQALAHQAPQLCPRDTLIAQVWPHHPPSPRSLDQYITRLRRQLKQLTPAPCNDTLSIETVHNQGYRLQWSP